MSQQEPHEAWRIVYDAYREAMPQNLLPQHLGQLGAFASEWLKTKDPSIMDGAISYCHINALPILPELLVYVHSAMQKRIADGTSGKKAFKHSAKQRVLEVMAKLVYHGASVRRAAEIGAYVSHFKISYPMKASSLEKEFSKQRQALMEFADQVFDSKLYTKEEYEKTTLMWQSIINANIEIPEEIIGDRR